jgi:mRNA-degrading endonuclease RelE of RelBE toxin-antitoxin system
MKIKAYDRFERCYQDLPKSIQKKVDRQIKILANDFRHPSLHTKKIKGSEGIWEARVDISYRLTFEVIEDTIFLRVVGNHDEVLKSP